MSKLFIVSFFFLCSCSVTFADMGMSFPSVHPDHPDKCWDKKAKEFYSVGVNYPEGVCKQIICASDFSILWFTCGKSRVLSGSDYRFAYHKGLKRVKRYPDCCPNY